MTERQRVPRLITSEADILAELESLVALDDRLAMVVESAGSVPLRLRPGGLKGLCAIVTAQQVSKASADAIFGRLSDQADLDDALAVRALGDDAFRAAGVSRPKQRTILGLAEAAADGVAELVALKGIGIWTAQCYLLFCVGHRDVFPGGDLALQAALAHAFALSERPKPKEADRIAADWAPHRSVAARLFWSYYAATARRDAAPL